MPDDREWRAQETRRLLGRMDALGLSTSDVARGLGVSLEAVRLWRRGETLMRSSYIDAAEAWLSKRPEPRGRYARTKPDRVLKAVEAALRDATVVGLERFTI